MMMRGHLYIRDLPLLLSSLKSQFRPYVTFPFFRLILIPNTFLLIPFSIQIVLQRPLSSFLIIISKYFDDIFIEFKLQKKSLCASSHRLTFKLTIFLLLFMHAKLNFERLQKVQKGECYPAGPPSWRRKQEHLMRIWQQKTMLYSETMTT